MRRLAIALVLLGAACTDSGSKPAARRAPATSTTTTVTTTTTTTLPPPTTTLPTECPLPLRAIPDANRPRYVLHVNVDPAAHRVTGDLTVRFTPDRTTDQLVFRLWPNGPRPAGAGAKLTVGAVQIGAHPVTATQPTPTTLVVPLAPPLAAGQTIEAALTWDLQIAGPNNDRIAQIGDTIRLGSFFPILAWEPGVGWATEPPVSAFAEASTAPVADFDMSLTVPPGLDVLATGVPDSGRTRWRAEAMRDVAVSVGHFRIAQASSAGVQVTVGVAADVTDSAQAYATKLATRLGQLSRILGPYPWTTYTLSITSSLRGGIEYPTHVMQGPGTGGRTTTHELAHQWFYGLVGNNQGRDPWLDEGLATYAEGRTEGNLSQLRATAVPVDARGRLAAPMTYWEAHQPSYYRGVYVQGAQALASLGPVERVDCALRLYIARNAHRVAWPADLVDAVSVVFSDGSEKLRRFGVTSNP